MITGRNHGAAGFEQIAELSTGFPGYNGMIGKDNATIARILQANGYATAWFRKDHNVPLNQMTEADRKTGGQLEWFSITSTAFSAAI